MGRDTNWIVTTGHSAGIYIRYCNIRLNEKQYKQLWFDDVTSLSGKYDWIKNKKLGGVGIWALGFDNGHQELWKLLSEKFSQE